jgi:hypothetical protein
MQHYNFQTANSIPPNAGMIDKNIRPRCNHPNHNPPTHLYIPPDKLYVHVCPACNHQQTISGIDITC